MGSGVWKTAFCFFLGVGLLVFCGAQSSNKVLRARCFHITSHQSMRYNFILLEPCMICPLDVTSRIYVLHFSAGESYIKVTLDWWFVGLSWLIIWKLVAWSWLRRRVRAVKLQQPCSFSRPRILEKRGAAVFNQNRSSPTAGENLLKCMKVMGSRK